MTTLTDSYSTVCRMEDLVPYSGVAALMQNRQVALFFIPHLEPSVYAISNFDPMSGANVLARGIVATAKVSPALPRRFISTTSVY